MERFLLSDSRSQPYLKTIREKKQDEIELNIQNRMKAKTAKSGAETTLLAAKPGKFRQFHKEPVGTLCELYIYKRSKMLYKIFRAAEQRTGSASDKAAGPALRRGGSMVKE